MIVRHIVEISEDDVTLVTLTALRAVSSGIIIAYQESIIVSFEDSKANFLKMLTDLDHVNLRTVLLQTPNTSHSYPF